MIHSISPSLKHLQLVVLKLAISPLVKFLILKGNSSKLELFHLL